MALKLSFLRSWFKIWFSWLSSGSRQTPVRKRPMRRFAMLGGHVEWLESRSMLSVTVTSDTSDLQANATQIVIAGSGFDPIVDNNTVTFNDNATGTVVEATATSLTVEFDALPETAGSLTATVTSTGGA